VDGKKALPFSTGYNFTVYLQQHVRHYASTWWVYHLGWPSTGGREDPPIQYLVTKMCLCGWLSLVLGEDMMQRWEKHSSQNNSSHIGHRQFLRVTILKLYSTVMLLAIGISLQPSVPLATTQEGKAGAT
jgi:hypothetical protein